MVGFRVQIKWAAVQKTIFSEMISLAELSNKKADNTTLAYKVNDILSTFLSC